MWQASAIFDDHSQQIIEEIPAPPIKYLVFEGGGVRGLAYRDVVLKLKDAGVLETVEHVAGSSAGAIAAMLTALGYPEDPTEFKTLLGNLCFKDFLESPKPWAYTPEIVTSWKQYLTIITTASHSLSSGAKLEAWIEARIETKLGNKRATFLDLAKRIESDKQKGIHVFKYLSVTGSNLTKNRLDIFNHETAPHMPLAVALRISTAFPSVFKAVEWNDGQGVCLYLDGGIMQNLPYFIFRDEKYLPEPYSFNKRGINPAVLNIKVDTPFETALAWNKNASRLIKSLKDFSRAILDGMQSRDREIFDEYATNIIQIDDGYIGTLQYDLLRHQKEMLFLAGEISVTEWLENHISEAYDIKTYPNQEAWLAAKKLDQLAAIFHEYETKLTKIGKTNELYVRLEAKCKSLQKYILWRTIAEISSNSLKESTVESDNFDKAFALLKEAKSPKLTDHIDLLPHKPRQQMDEKLKKNMRLKLQCVQNKKTFVLDKINHYLRQIVFDKPKVLHQENTYEKIVSLVNLEEDKKLLLEHERDLLIKLKQTVPKIELGVFYCEPEYNLFVKEINQYILSKLPSCQLARIIQQHLLNQSIKYQCENNLNMTLDLRNRQDLQLYVMAYAIYLRCLSSHLSLQEKTLGVYSALFNTDHLPKTLEQLGSWLNLNPQETLIFAYRLEKLLNDFIRADPSQKKSKLINLDRILNGIAHSPHKKLLMDKTNDISADNEIEMNFLYQSFTTKEKFLMFHDIEKNKEMALFAERVTPNQSLTNSDGKGPKCFRRFE